MQPVSWPLWALAGTAIGLVAALSAAFYWQRHAAAADADRRRTSVELDRRLSELFSLQELAYVLSDSLQLDRIVEQVARYAMRFLDARGALVALVGDKPLQPQRVVAAEGTLAGLLHANVSSNDDGLLGRSRARDRLELVQPPDGSPVPIAGGVAANSAAAVPLRAHGVVVGTLVIADPRIGGFEPEDIRLLSTVATHAAVVLANARFFAMVEHAKEEWETTFDALREGIAVVDASGRVQRANRALAELLHRPVPGLVGDDLAGALFDGLPALADLLRHAAAGHRPPALVARSASLGRTLRLNAASIPDAAAARSVVVLVEDVTDEQTMEAQLIQSEKLAAVGQLVSGVAHELNNPLTSIAGLSELLLEQREGGPRDREHLQVIHEQAERAGRIVRNLLTFARPGGGDATRVNVADVVRRTLQLMSYDLRMKNIEVDQDLAADLPDVLGDRHALQQVVLNLLSNAAQAVADLPPGSTRHVAVRTWADAQVHIRVADSGPGVPAEVAPHVFTPFFTTKEPGQGTGLGLSITYSIVEAHGGHIGLEPATGGGAAFRVDLPVAPADAPEPSPRVESSTASPSATPAAGVPRRILLVDDDPAVGRLVRALFAREGHAVEVEPNATLALELGAQPWDLVIADARATALGRLFVEELLERYPDLRERTLVATGDVRPATQDTIAGLGLPYLRKPFNLRLLRDEATRLWAPATLL